MNPSYLFIITLLSPLLTAAAPAHPLTTYDGFADYPANAQIESGSNGSSGTPVDGGLGWGGPYDVNNSIKSLVRAENRTSPVVYARGDISIQGGARALRLYDIANGAYVLQRALGKTFSAAAGESLWFSFLFRTNNPSPLTNRDYFHAGFDDNPQAEGGTPRVGVGAATISSIFPPDQPFQFFAKSTTSDATMVFAETEIATATTYLLVGRISATGPTYDTVDLFIDPTSTTDPGPPSATASVDSGLERLSHFFLRTSGLDNGDAYVMDELKIGLTYTSVTAAPPLELRFEPGGNGQVQWSALLSTAVLQTSDSLAGGTWNTVPGPFAVEGTEFVHPVTAEGGARRFYRLWRP